MLSLGNTRRMLYVVSTISHMGLVNDYEQTYTIKGKRCEGDKRIGGWKAVGHGLDRHRKRLAFQQMIYQLKCLKVLNMEHRKPATATPNPRELDAV